jgi:hypothetical protein
MTCDKAAGIIAVGFEEGIAPWSRSSRLHINCGLPGDAATGKPFRGVNTWLLELSALRKKYRNRFWETRGGWEHLGGVVVRGEETPVIDDGAGGGKLLYNLEQVEVRPGRPVTALGCPREGTRILDPTSDQYARSEMIEDLCRPRERFPPARGQSGRLYVDSVRIRRTSRSDRVPGKAATASLGEFPATSVSPMSERIATTLLRVVSPSSSSRVQENPRKARETSTIAWRDWLSRSSICGSRR